MQQTDYDVTIYLDEDVNPYAREFFLLDAHKPDADIARALFVHLQHNPRTGIARKAA